MGSNKSEQWGIFTKTYAKNIDSGKAVDKKVRIFQIICFLAFLNGLFINNI